MTTGDILACFNFVYDIDSPIWTSRCMVKERTRSVWGTCCPCHTVQSRKKKNKREIWEEWEAA